MEKLVSSKLMKKDANKRIATVDRHVGVVRLAHHSQPQLQHEHAR
jgi:hypothetical protein